MSDLMPALVFAALLLAGYSVMACVVLAAAVLRADALRDKVLSRAMGVVLLVALAGLQLSHFAELRAGGPAAGGLGYRLMLFVVAPAFYLFSRALVQAAGPAGSGLKTGLHALPLALALLVPATWTMPIAFGLGAGYLVWLARSLYRLRAQRSAFAVEMALLGTAFALAAAVVVMGSMPGAMSRPLFVSLYASAIGLALLLVQLSLTWRPQLPAEVRETAQAAYAATTLARVDCDAAIAKLEAVLADKGVYADPELGLASLAARVGLSAHQLSELLNVRLGKSFARVLRERRVQAARAMLLAEPSASVLSVGLSVGFGTQSNFYEAFREIEGMAPGQFRKLHKGGSDRPDSTIPIPN